MKIVITGANGFVGAALCRYFHTLGHEIIATGRQQQPNQRLLEFARYVPWDITQPIEPFKADVCIHAAGLASDTAEYEALYLNNVQGTRNVLRAAIYCKYFVFISSSSVYNFGPLPVPELDSSSKSTLSEYGKTKLEAEQLVKADIPENQYRIILRPRGIYGIGDRVLLPRILGMLKWGAIICPIKSGIKTSATHIDNLAFAIKLFLQQAAKPQLQLFNIADDGDYDLREMFLTVLTEIEQKKIPIINISTKILALFPGKHSSPIAFKAITENSVIDISHIKRELKYAPTQTFQASIADIADWINSCGGREDYMKMLPMVPWKI